MLKKESNRSHTINILVSSGVVGLELICLEDKLDLREEVMAE